jgi:subtilisin family serine protease
MSRRTPAISPVGALARLPWRPCWVLALGSLLLLFAGEVVLAQGAEVGAGQPGASSIERPDQQQARENRQPARNPNSSSQKAAGSRNIAQTSTRSGFLPPPDGEQRFVPNELVLDIASTVPTQTLDEVAKRHHLTRMGSQSFELTGHTLYRWRIDDGRSIPEVIRDLQTEEHITAAQPNYTFTLQDPAPRPTERNPAQYSVAKLHLGEAHQLATGARVPVAIIDSAVDATHPELRDVVAASFDAIGGPATPDAHGTAIAGAIAAHGRLVGAAPRVRLLAVRAFGDSSAGAKATTFGILRGLDWAVSQGARIVNMSFAGPADPALKDALAFAHKKGLVLIAAAGNAGAKSPPLYPGADPHVIAVTAVDADDKLFPQANRGNYIAIAAPGVDVLVPAPDGGMQLTSGTSVAAAQVSGIAALMLERNPSLGSDGARKILMATARHLGPKPRDTEFGAGLANAFLAVKAVEPKSAEQLSSGLPPTH